MSRNTRKNGRVGSADVVTAKRPGVGNRFAYLGDSTTIGHSDGTDPIWSGPQLALGNAWPTWVSIMSNGRIRHAINAGKGGNNSADMLARVDTEVTPYGPTAVTILAGTNDVTQGLAWTTTRDNIIAIVGKVLEIGATPILCTVLPNSQGTPSDRITKTQQINAWLRTYASNSGFPLVDFHRALTDTNGQYVAGATADNLHPTPAGHLTMAQTFLTAVLPLVPSGDALLPTSTANNLLGNALFTSSSGGVPTTWTAFGAGANMTSTIDSSDTSILGNWAQTVVTDTTWRGLYMQILSGFAVGDRIAFCGRIQYTYVAGIGARARMVAVGPNTSYSPANNLATTFGPGIFYKEIVVPSGTTRLDVYLGGTQGTSRYAQVGAFNLTGLGLPAATGYPLS